MKINASRAVKLSEGVEHPSVVESILEKKMEDMTLLLCDEGNGRSRLYEEVITMVERSLFKIALQRSHNIKSAAATYLGMNRNTFQNKMAKLGLNGHRD